MTKQTANNGVSNMEAFIDQLDKLENKWVEAAANMYPGSVAYLSFTDGEICLAFTPRGSVSHGAFYGNYGECVEYIDSCNAGDTE